ELVGAMGIEMDGRCYALGDERLNPVHVDPSSLQGAAVSELRYEKGQADRGHLGQVGLGDDVVRGERHGQCQRPRGDGFAERKALGRRQFTPDKSSLASVILASVNRYWDRPGLLFEGHCDRRIDLTEFIRRRQSKCGPDVGMSGKGNLPGGREDANPTGIPRLRGEYECTFGEIELPGNPLHLL